MGLSFSNVDPLQIFKLFEHKDASTKHFFDWWPEHHENETTNAYLETHEIKQLFQELFGVLLCLKSRNIENKI